MILSRIITHDIKTLTPAKLKIIRNPKYKNTLILFQEIQLINTNYFILNKTYI